MKSIFKIILLILAVLPIWLTIVVCGNEAKTPGDEWKSKLNSKLLELKDKKIQVIQLLPALDDFGSISADTAFDLEITELNVRGISTLSLQVKDDAGRLLKRVRMPAKLLVEYQVPVASHTLGRGDSIQREDFQLEWKDATSLKNDTVRLDNISGRLVRSNIQEGDPVYEANLQRQTLVAKGDRVRIAVVSGGIYLSGIGVAQESGSRGETIKVINIDSKKEVLGTVTSAKTVEVRI